MNRRLRLPKGRIKLSTVLQTTGDIVRTDDVERSLNVDRSTASKLLSRWSRQGWLRRAGRGIYAVASLDCIDAEQVLDDSWIIVPDLFDPAYIGGRTATEYWDLTDQIFLDTVVITGRPVRLKYQKRLAFRIP